MSGGRRKGDQTMKKPTIRAKPVYEFACPDCGQKNQIDEGEFFPGKVYDENGDWKIADKTSFDCSCGAEFTVTHD